MQSKDFLPDLIAEGSIFSPPDLKSFDSSISAASLWLKESGVKPLQIETVILPHVFKKGEHGSTDVSLPTGGSYSFWHQFLRVWFDPGAPSRAPLLQYRDFVPQKKSSGIKNLFKSEEQIFESFEDAVAAAAEWRRGLQYPILQIETLAIPDLWERAHKGDTKRPDFTAGDYSDWHQFIRVWFDAAPLPEPYR